MHRRIYALDVPWAQHLEGSYVPHDRLRRVDPSRSQYVYLDNGATELITSDHCNTAVVRWSLREHGVVLAGPDPRSLVDSVSAAQLRADVRTALPEWERWAHESQERFESASGGAPAWSRWKQALVVLSYCRMLQTLADGLVTSKRAAGAWALAMLDPEWRSLVQRALDDRPDHWGRVHEAAERADIDRTLAFVEYVTRKAATLVP